MIWLHGQELLNEFVEYLNNREDSIKFTCNTSDSEIEFLDTVIYHNNGTLESKLYLKPTNSLSYLERNSFHPRSTFSSLPYGEFVRIKRNCSKPEIYEIFSQKIKQAFINRGYKPAAVEEARLKAATLNRQDMLKTYRNLSHTDTNDVIHPPRDNIHFVSTFHPESAKIRNLITNNWKILGTSDITRDLYNTQVIYGFRRNKRLRDLLVHTQIPLPPKPGIRGKSTPHCERSECIYCFCLDKSGWITSTTLKKSFTSKINICCQSSNVVYCLQCKVCNKQYVGETKRTFHERVREHFRNIRKGISKEPLGRHFNLPGHHNDPKNLKAYILAFITAPPDSKDALKMRLKFELSWIHRLRTSLPMGLNSMD